MKKTEVLVEVLSDKPIREGKESEALDFILSNCLKSGFGTLGKSEIDLILFTCLLKYSKQQNLSDYALSKYLQITQQRIRNLKEKASIKYMAVDRESAIRTFIEKSGDAKIEDKYIDVPINDIAVKNEIEAILDEESILLHYQLNPKIFRIRIDDFMELIIQFESVFNPGKSKKSIESKVLKLVNEKTDDNELLSELLTTGKGDGIGKLTKTTLKEALVKGGLSFGIDLLASLIPGGAFLSTPVKELLNKMSEKI